MAKREEKEKNPCLKINRPLFNRRLFMLETKERRTKGDSRVAELSVKSLVQKELIRFKAL